jgi:hypothetical protein
VHWLHGKHMKRQQSEEKSFVGCINNTDLYALKISGT